MKKDVNGKAYRIQRGIFHNHILDTEAEPECTQRYHSPTASTTTYTKRSVTNTSQCQNVSRCPLIRWLELDTE